MSQISLRPISAACTWALTAWCGLWLSFLVPALACCCLPQTTSYFGSFAAGLGFWRPRLLSRERGRSPPLLMPRGGQPRSKGRQSTTSVLINYWERRRLAGEFHV